jgi:hypothetical protein
MSTWFLVVGRVLYTDPIAFSPLTNARLEYKEGDLNTRPTDGTIRHIDISFYGNMLQSGKAYIVFGAARLPATDDYDTELMASISVAYKLYSC